MKYVRLVVEMAALYLAASAPVPAGAQTLAVRPDGRADLVWNDPAGTLTYKWAVPGYSWQSTAIDTYTLSRTGAGEFLGAAIAVRPGGWQNSFGEADIAATTYTHDLFYYYSSPMGLCLFGHANSSCGSDATVTWSPRNAVSNSAYSAPALAVRPNGEADIVVQGPNNSLLHYHAAPGQAWAADPTPVAPNNSAYSAPAIAVLPGGEVAVVVQGPGNSLSYYESTTPSPTGPSTWAFQTISQPGTIASLELPAASSPAIVARSTGEVDVVGVGAGNTLLYFYSGPPYSNWPSIAISGPKTAYTAPVMAVRSTDPAGEVDVVVGNTYYHATPDSFNPNPYWSPSTLPYAGLPTGIAVRSANPAGEADVVAVNSQFATLYYSWAAPGSPWSSMSWTDYSYGQRCPGGGTTCQ